MRGFEADGDRLVAELEEFEVALVASLVEQLMELLGGAEQPPASDPFERLRNDYERSVELDHSDPLVQRLFPDAYMTDRGASDDFRRYTEDESRRGRIADAEVVLADLAGVDERTSLLLVPRDNAEAWLRTINALRLSLSVRLRIVDEQSHDELAALPARDPRSQLLNLYDWFGYLLETLIEAMYA